jgi:hypothetical protein
VEIGKASPFWMTNELKASRKPENIQYILLEVSSKVCFLSFVLILKQNTISLLLRNKFKICVVEEACSKKKPPQKKEKRNEKLREEEAFIYFFLDD